MRHLMKWLAAIVLCAGMAIPVLPAQAKAPGPNGQIAFSRYVQDDNTVTFAWAGNTGIAMPAHSTMAVSHFIRCLTGDSFQFARVGRDPGLSVLARTPPLPLCAGVAR